MNKILRNVFVAAMAMMSLSGMAQITFDASADKGTCDASNPGADQVTKDGVTIAVSNGAMNLTDQYRCYKSATFTVLLLLVTSRRLRFPARPKVKPSTVLVVSLMQPLVLMLSKVRWVLGLAMPHRSL